MSPTVILIASRSGATLERRTLTGGRLALGRSAACDWHFGADKKVSNHHCVVEFSDRGLLVRDLSTNGTFLNSEEFPIGKNQTRALGHGDRICIGSYEIDVQLDGASGIPFGIEHGIPNTEIAAFDNDRPSAPPSYYDPFREPVDIPDGPEEAVSGGVDETGNDLAPEEPGADTLGRPARVPPPVQSNALSGLLAGADLHVEHAARAVKDPDATLHTAGQLLKAAVAGLRALLRARNDVKQEYRIEVTIVGNSVNALKFSATDELALAALLDPKRKSLRDVEEVIKDLQIHQLATSQATQAAARALLAQLSPANLEGKEITAVKFQVPGQREKRLWEAYKKQHTHMVEQFEDNFKSEFYTAFALAYERATGRRKKAKQ